MGAQHMDFPKAFDKVPRIRLAQDEREWMQKMVCCGNQKVVLNSWAEHKHNKL